MQIQLKQNIFRALLLSHINELMINRALIVNSMVQAVTSKLTPKTAAEVEDGKTPELDPTIYKTIKQILRDLNAFALSGGDSTRQGGSESTDGSELEVANSSSEVTQKAYMLRSAWGYLTKDEATGQEIISELEESFNSYLKLSREIASWAMSINKYKDEPDVEWGASAISKLLKKWGPVDLHEDLDNRFNRLYDHVYFFSMGAKVHQLLNSEPVGLSYASHEDFLTTEYDSGSETVFVTNRLPADGTAASVDPNDFSDAATEEATQYFLAKIDYMIWPAQVWRDITYNTVYDFGSDTFKAVITHVDGVVIGTNQVAGEVHPSTLGGIQVKLGYTAFEKFPFFYDLVLGVIFYELKLNFSNWSADCRPEITSKTAIHPKGIQPIALMDFKYTAITGTGKDYTPIQVGEDVPWSQSGFIQAESSNTRGGGKAIRAMFRSRTTFPDPAKNNVLVSNYKTEFTFTSDTNILGIEGPDHVIRLVEFTVFGQEHEVDGSVVDKPEVSSTYTASEVCSIINNVFGGDVLAIVDNYGRVVIYSGSSEPIRIVGTEQGSTANSVFGWYKYGELGQPFLSAGAINYELTAFMAGVPVGYAATSSFIKTMRKLIGPYRLVHGKAIGFSHNLWSDKLGEPPSVIGADFFLPPGHRLIGGGGMTVTNIQEFTVTEDMPGPCTGTKGSEWKDGAIPWPDLSQSPCFSDWGPARATDLGVRSPYWEGMKCGYGMYDTALEIWKKGDDQRFWSKGWLSAAENKLRLNANYYYAVPSPHVCTMLTARTDPPYTFEYEPSNKRFIAIRKVKLDVANENDREGTDWIFVELPTGVATSGEAVIKAMQRDALWLQENCPGCQPTMTTDRLDSSGYLLLDAEGGLQTTDFKFEDVDGRLRISIADQAWGIRLGGAPELSYGNSVFGWRVLGELGDPYHLPGGPYYNYTYEMDIAVSKEAHPCFGGDQLITPEENALYRYEIEYTRNQQACGRVVLVPSFVQATYLELLRTAFDPSLYCKLSDMPISDIPLVIPNSQKGTTTLDIDYPVVDPEQPDIGTPSDRDLGGPIIPARDDLIIETDPTGTIIVQEYPTPPLEACQTEISFNEVTYPCPCEVAGCVETAEAGVPDYGSEDTNLFMKELADDPFLGQLGKYLNKVTVSPDFDKEYVIHLKAVEDIFTSLMNGEVVTDDYVMQESPEHTSFFIDGLSDSLTLAKNNVSLNLNTDLFEAIKDIATLVVKYTEIYNNSGEVDGNSYKIDNISILDTSPSKVVTLASRELFRRAVAVTKTTYGCTKIHRFDCEEKLPVPYPIFIAPNKEIVASEIQVDFCKYTDNCKITMKVDEPNSSGDSRGVVAEIESRGNPLTSSIEVPLGEEIDWPENAMPLHLDTSSICCMIWKPVENKFYLCPKPTAERKVEVTTPSLNDCITLPGGTLIYKFATTYHDSVVVVDLSGRTKIFRDELVAILSEALQPFTVSVESGAITIKSDYDNIEVSETPAQDAIGFMTDEIFPFTPIETVTVFFGFFRKRPTDIPRDVYVGS